ncbi:uncharacterized protein LOC117122762 [Anneissia japonica]|uniref:uncharacterized protein LOC117122762 n=1 Tax=Anneissia japonica TaxID=1529436 RepID=UPI0014254BC2|nr:uncharacterized protein LOC117122762 [Anneissia japonica]
MNLFSELKDNDLFNGDFLDKNLIQFCLMEIIQEFTSITPDTFKRIRSKERKHRRAFFRFRCAICLVVILTRAFRIRKKYFNTKKKGRRHSGANGGESNKSDTFITSLQTIRLANFKSSIALELQLYLTNLPEHRDERQIKKIIYYLRATKAFNIFPSGVEEDLARFIGYDCYDDGRIIAFQGRIPDRFYYVISGKIQLIRQYKLQTGVVNKVMTTLQKGSFTDAEELERQWLRQCHLVCKGMVEVLVLDKHVYFQLRNTIIGPPIEFLRSLDLLKDFPLEIFHQHPEAIQYKYYRNQNHRLKPRIKRTDSTRAPLDLPVLAIIEPEVSPTLHKPKYFRSSGLFMTQRSRTDTSVASGGPKRKGNCREPAGPQDVQRLAYLQVDTLQQGDIFGLNDLLGNTPSDQSGIAVWSEGAEIVAINKRFFKNNAGLPTMLRVDMLIRDWMNEEDASDRIETQDSWQEYKAVLMERMIENKVKQAQAKSLTSL